MSTHITTFRASHKACLSAAVLLTVVTANCWLPFPAAAQTYSFRTVEVPGSASSEIARSNNAGEMVGIFGTTQLFGGNSIFLASGVFTPIVIPGGGNSPTPIFALGINNHRQVVGIYTDQNRQQERGFLWNGPTRFFIFDVPGAHSTEGAAINDTGIVAGYYDDGSQFHGFTARCGPVNCSNFAMIDFPGAVGTTALGINNAGQVVGTYSLTDPYVNHARQGFFQDTDQSFTTVDFPGSAETLAYGINSSADIAGIYLDGNAAAHGFTRIGGTFATLDFPGAAETEPTGINDHKQVVGAYSFVNSRLTLDLYGFVATPVGGVNANGGTGRPRGGLWP
jgi:uncharacterized membrane protein